MQNCRKYLCFSKDLTLATRIIAFCGIAVSALLVTVLINDSSSKDYEKSRIIALALGLDWRHIHSKANTSEDADPEGKMISIVLIFYGVIFFITNVLLFFGSIAESRWFSIPWLSCELFSCTSKLFALIFHVVTELDNLSNLFITGSLVYITIMAWLWSVVYVAQATWIKNNHVFIEENETTMEFSSILFDSPKPYSANQQYRKI